MTANTENDSTDSTASNETHASPQLTAAAKAYQNPYYRYLVLGILTAAYVSNFVDRQVINVLAQYIIEDLQISDGQFGMLSNSRVKRTRFGRG